MLNVVAERRGTLASYEVAGVGEQNEFVPRRTTESGGRFHRPIRTDFAWGRKPGTLGGLISDAPWEQNLLDSNWMASLVKTLASHFGLWHFIVIVITIYT